MAKPGLNTKQRKVLAAVSEGKTIAAAARDAGYSAVTANRGLAGVCGNNRAKLDEFHKLLDSRVPLEALVKLFEDASKATRPILKRTKKATRRAADGVVQEVAEHEYEREPDYTMRLKAAESLTRLQGYAKDPSPVSISVDARSELAESPTDRNAEEEQRAMGFSRLALRKARSFDIELPRELTTEPVDLQEEESGEWKNSGIVQ